MDWLLLLRHRATSLRLDELSQPRSMRPVKIGLIAVVVVMMITAHQLGVFEHFGDPGEVKRALLLLGPWGYIAFIGAYTVLQPFGVPGTVFVWAAPLIWSWPVAFALSMTGTMAASIVGFSFARFIARDWVAERIPARFRKYDEALARRGFVTVLSLRFLLWMPPMLHAFFGVSKVPFWTHFWGSLFGYAVPLFLVSFFGQQLLTFFSALPRGVWIGVAVVAAVIGLGVWFRRRCPAEAVER